MYHDRTTLKRCVREGRDSFNRFGYDDPVGCPYTDSERSLAWLRGVFRAEHERNGNTPMVMDDNSFYQDLWREIKLSKQSQHGFSGEY